MGDGPIRPILGRQLDPGISDQVFTAQVLSPVQFSVVFSVKAVFYL